MISFNKKPQESGKNTDVHLGFNYVARHCCLPDLVASTRLAMLLSMYCGGVGIVVNGLIAKKTEEFLAASNLPCLVSVDYVTEAKRLKTHGDHLSQDGQYAAARSFTKGADSLGRNGELRQVCDV
ncbi:hypothetical protein HYALB_00013672 [Hymenoscyphus albidus]|uniref:Uncharacterized protein n=1 Tax=Hymenoscyphus albidus TaxID=595503 RepID=A0A9N9LXK5_9HELO|nr:hypothetical protein HYALB_00013672 [Hymenoscyphus albidus]